LKRIAANDQAETATSVDDANLVKDGRSIHFGTALENENMSVLWNGHR
jgi:hypothetical protein